MATERSSMARRLAAFALPPLLGMLAPMVALPTVASHTTVSGWAALATGQSLGSVAAIVVGLGWPLIGSAEIARTPSEAASLHFEGLVTRLLALGALTVPLGFLAGALAPSEHLVLAAVSAISNATLGLSIAWVAVGLNRPDAIMTCEVLPRLVAGIASAGLIANGAPAAVYPLLTLISSIAGVSAFSVFVVRPRRTSRTALLHRLRHLVVPALTTAASSVYTAGALVLVTVSTSISDTAIVSSADRLYRIGLFAVVASANALQSWVVQPESVADPERQRFALRVHFVLGAMGGIAFFAAAPTAARLLFGSDVAPSSSVAFFYGLSFCFISLVTTFTQHRLIPADRTGTVLRTTLVACTVGSAAICGLSWWFGATGAAAGIALGELVVLLMQGVAVARPAGMSRRRTPRPHASDFRSAGNEHL